MTERGPFVWADHPAIRILNGRPLVVLTQPQRWAITVDADGVLAVRPLSGVRVVMPWEPAVCPTEPQRVTLARMGITD